jgi:Ca2+-binding EF-hand superfamily protein
MKMHRYLATAGTAAVFFFFAPSFTVVSAASMADDSIGLRETRLTSQPPQKPVNRSISTHALSIKEKKAIAAQRKEIIARNGTKSTATAPVQQPQQVATPQVTEEGKAMAEGMAKLATKGIYTEVLDVNADGALDVSDVMQVINNPELLASKVQEATDLVEATVNAALSGKNGKQFDLNKDGVVDITDVMTTINVLQVVTHAKAASDAIKNGARREMAEGLVKFALTGPYNKALDVNTDGKLDVWDVVQAINNPGILAAREKEVTDTIEGTKNAILTGNNDKQYDSNNDGEVNVQDMVIMLNVLQIIKDAKVAAGTASTGARH